MEAFGHLYIPMAKGMLFRDNFYAIDGELYTSHYGGLGILSPVIAGHEVLSQIDINKTNVLKALQAPSALARVFCKLWERFDRQFKNTQKIDDVWPLTVANNPQEFSCKQTTERLVLRSENNFKQNERIFQEARSFFRIVRVAFSEDFVRLLNYLNLLQRSENFCLEINLPDPKSLQKICERELSEIRELERDWSILSELESHYDIQARSKYLSDRWANFARATVDSLCAIRAIEIFFKASHNESDQSRFTLKLFQGAPTFRGTITDQEIAYVNTVPWQPGMMGNLYVHRFKEVPQNYWYKILKKFNQELDSMGHVKYKFSDAIELLENAAIEAIYKAQTQNDKGKKELNDLRYIIQSVRMVKSEKKESIKSSFERLIKIREIARYTFRNIFYGLDQDISKTTAIALEPSSIKTYLKNEPLDPLVKIIDKIEEVISIFKAMQNTPKYDFKNAQKVQIFEKVETYIENQVKDKSNLDSDIECTLDDLKQVISVLRQRHPQATEEQATAIIEAEFKEIKHNQPHRWQNLLSLKHLWNGIKNGSFKAGEHFVEETPWGKGVLGFLEGIMEEVEFNEME